MIRVSAPKDLWAGLIYLGFGVAGLWLGAAYPMGSAGKMGSGYFPKVLATALVIFGLVAIARSLVLNGSADQRACRSNRSFSFSSHARCSASCSNRSA